MPYPILRTIPAIARAAAVALGRRAQVRVSPRGALAVVAGFVVVAGGAYGLFLLVLSHGTPEEGPAIVTPLSVGSRLPALAGPCLNGPPPGHLPPPGYAVAVVDVWADW